LVEHRRDLVGSPAAGHPPVDRQPLVHVRDVALVDAEIDPQVHGGSTIVLDVLALQLADGLLEQLRVHIEANRLDVPPLLAAEKIAGAADLEIQRRDTEAAAKVAELANGCEPPTRDRRERLLRRNQQIRVGATIRTANAAAKLIQLRQT